jgi:hypothetical protein
MNLDPRHEPSEMRQQPSGQLYVPFPKGVGDPVKPKGMKPGVTQEHFQHAPSGRVFGKNRPNIFFQAGKHARSPLLLRATVH